MPRELNRWSIALLVSTAVAATVAMSSPARADDYAPRFPAGQVAAWKGTVEVRQTVDGDAAPVSRFDAHVLRLVSADGASIDVFRTLTPRSSDDASAAMADRYARASTTALPLLDEPPQELDGAADLLQVYVPRLPLSLGAVVAEAQGPPVERDVAILGSLRVRGKVATTMSTGGADRVLSRELIAGSTATASGEPGEPTEPTEPAEPFEFQGHVARLVAWRETYTWSVEQRLIRSRRFTYSARIDMRGTPV